MKNQPKVKILLSYHKPSELLKNNIFQPIHVGRALTNENMKTGDKKKDYEWLKNNLIGDDTGENISSKNPNYCELTAQYWAWKNPSKLENPDYIGFMHYRRHLNFNVDKKYNENKWGTIDNNYLDGFYIEKYGLDEDNIKNIVTQYDIVTVNPWSVKNAGSKNNYDHYATSDPKIHIKDYDLVLEILQQKYPEYKEDINIYNNSELGYYTNIFIMKKDIFNQYSHWLFDILFEVEKQVDISNYDFQEARIFGYLSEWLFGIYITHLKRTTKLKIKNLQRTMINNFDFVQDKNAINLCFSSDENYLQHLSVAIISILKNTQAIVPINIFILQCSSKISASHKEKIMSLKAMHQNTSIHFINIDKSLFNDFPLIEGTHFTEAMYYRYIIPNIFINLDKVLYLDCDLVVTADISDLFRIDLANNYIGAVQDMVGCANQLRLGLNKNGKNFYCNSGVLLMNLNLLRKDGVIDKLVQYTVKNRENLMWPDQDVINVVMEEKIKYLDLSWNLQYYYPNTVTDFDKDKFQKAIENPKIIHFIGYEKPWFINSHRPFKEQYYKYFKYSPWKQNNIRQYLFYYLKKLAQLLFSLKNSKSKKYKIVTFLGVKVKFRRKLYPLECQIELLQQQICTLDAQIKKIYSKN